MTSQTHSLCPMGQYEQLFLLAAVKSWNPSIRPSKPCS